MVLLVQDKGSRRLVKGGEGFFLCDAMMNMDVKEDQVHEECILVPQFCFFTLIQLINCNMHALCNNQVLTWTYVAMLEGLCVFHCSLLQAPLELYIQFDANKRNRDEHGCKMVKYVMHATCLSLKYTTSQLVTTHVYGNNPIYLQHHSKLIRKEPPLKNIYVSLLIRYSLAHQEIEIISEIRISEGHLIEETKKC